MAANFCAWVIFEFKSAISCSNVTDCSLDVRSSLSTEDSCERRDSNESKDSLSLASRLKTSVWYLSSSSVTRLEADDRARSFSSMSFLSCPFSSSRTPYFCLSEAYCIAPASDARTASGIVSRKYFSITPESDFKNSTKIVTKGFPSISRVLRALSFASSGGRCMRRLLLRSSDSIFLQKLMEDGNMFKRLFARFKRCKFTRRSIWTCTSLSILFRAERNVSSVHLNKDGSSDKRPFEEMFKHLRDAESALRSGHCEREFSLISK
mmetsp:Transcript_3722/g.6552  ORF Transcript_3722/g.6552 Transcript_3722/m.6552 type:complete len:265 (-) Transcript_3722:110-904(-)